MSTTSRLNNLLLNQDWTRIYQTFKNADFKSYDFENLRRVIIEYLRENYAEDFNDYIESSEYMALIDAIAFVGQSLSFRIDLASRENFIEIAERKESVLRLARMLSYNAKRNIPATGLLKFETISTSEPVFDSAGRNLSQQTIVWNDPTNPNWYEQFLAVINAAMSNNTEFGRNQGEARIDGIDTEQYRFRSALSDIPLFSFTKSVAGRSMVFEIVSTSFKDREFVYEENPEPGNQIGFIYRQDNKGAGSQNTGFYMMFKQGSLETADFAIDIPTTNEKVAVATEGINNTDVWLYSLDSIGNQTTQWTKVESLIGNNIAYNSINSDIRNIYNVVTKENDKVELVFADGVYGNLPQGSFRVFYRISNGLSYQINPVDMRNINIAIPYISKTGTLQSLNISMALKYTVTSSAPSEDIDTIRERAPALYYTQNRMITAEDYQLAPLSSSQNILKVRAINRTSSGISRNFEIIDASGKYSGVNIFASDGLIYKNDNEITLSFKFANKQDILNFIKNDLELEFQKSGIYNFYLAKYSKILFSDNNTLWTQVSKSVNQSTGYFVSAIDSTLIKVGSAYTTNILKSLQVGSLIKFVPPAGKAFKDDQIVDADFNDYKQVTKLWTKAVRVVGDGTNAGRGVLTNGLGPIEFNDIIPTGAIASRIVPRFVNDLSTSLELEIVNITFANLNFGLRYDINDAQWKIVDTANLNTINEFSLGKAGDTTNSNLDSSWLIAFVKIADRYVVRIRTLDYIFGSLEQNRFYFDANQKAYDARNNAVVKDQIRVLGINTSSDFINPLKSDLTFEISDMIEYDDGYQATDEIKISFSDSDDDGVIDNPEQFEDIVGLDSQSNFLFFQETTDSFGQLIYKFIDNSNGNILIRQKESLVNINDNEFTDGRLVYFYDIDENNVKRVDKSTNTFILEPSYRANIGRNNIKFQYIHNASVDRRIDPSVSNIIDIFLLTRSYDTEFRNYLQGFTSIEPEAPSSDDLRINFDANLTNIKTISDEIIYHPVTYKILFGRTATSKLQAIFKIVKNSNKSINDNDLKVRIISAINDFFNINNWDFGDTFYLSELITYVTNSTSPDISNMVIVPRQENQVFGSLFEIKSRSDEIFISGATVDDVEIVPAIIASEIKANVNNIISST
jgi:hypothetical protein